MVIRGICMECRRINSHPDCIGNNFSFIRDYPKGIKFYLFSYTRSILSARLQFSTVAIFLSPGPNGNFHVSNAYEVIIKILQKSLEITFSKQQVTHAIRAVPANFSTLFKNSIVKRFANLGTFITNAHT